MKGGHHGAISTKPNVDNLVTMLRHPRQRLISAFLHDLHDCTDQLIVSERARIFAAGNNSHAVYLELVRNRDTVALYTRCVQGRAVHMFNGKPGNGGNFQTPTRVEVEKAKVMLARAAFVGIIERWKESVCLYQSRFGGEVSDVMFRVGRASKYPKLKNELDKTLTAIGWEDPVEFELYNLGLQRFNLEVLKHTFYLK